MARSKKSPAYERLTINELRIVDRRGKLRAFLATNESDDCPQLEMYDKDGLGRLSIGLGRDGTSHISVQYENGDVAVGIGIGGPDHTPGIQVNCSDGRMVFLAKADDNIGGHIMVYDKSGTCVWSVPK